MRFTSGQVAAVVGGCAVSPNTVVDGASTDTRALLEGQLFVPLIAERDGHDFIDAAVTAGAPAYLTERDDTRQLAIVVGNTAAALRDLAAHAVKRLHASTVGITGSVGKTITKDLLTAVLRTDRTTHASARSFNNLIGLPLTIVNAPEIVDALVLEMGANAPGEIAQLCEIATPNVGVVTRVAAAHTLGFGDVEGVAAAKSELVRALPGSGTAVLNADDERVFAMRTVTDATVVTFGEAGDVRVRLVGLTPDLRPRIHVDTPWGAFDTIVAARGAHQSTNAGAVTAAAGAMGVPVDRIAAGLTAAAVSGKRMDLRRSRSGVWILDDSYNANPASVEAALQALCDLGAARRVAVLGTMSELGELSNSEHRRIAELARSLDVEILSVCEPAYGVHDTPSAELAGAAIEAMQLSEGDAILVKGSRVAELDQLARRLDKL